MNSSNPENTKVKIDASEAAIKEAGNKQDATKKNADKAEKNSSEAKGISEALMVFTKSAPANGDYMGGWSDNHVTDAEKLITVVDTARKTGKELPKEASKAYQQAELVLSIVGMEDGTEGEANE